MAYESNLNVPTEQKAEWSRQGQQAREWILNNSDLMYYALFNNLASEYLTGGGVNNTLENTQALYQIAVYTAHIYYDANSAFIRGKWEDINDL